jgi:exodeoxyribonuclease VIII
VLEPDELNKRYALCPSRTTKAGKEKAAELEADGIEAVTDSDMELALAMSNAVRSHTVAGDLLRDGKAEQSFWWDDLPTGLRCKCRPDWYHGSTIVDLKTTTDASPQGFAASVAKWRYHVQQAHYLSGTFADRFVFIAVEKTYPYGVGVYELDANARQQGELIRRKSLEQLNDCLIIDEWLGYTSAIESLSLPGWAFKSNDVMTSNDF